MCIRDRSIRGSDAIFIAVGTPSRRGDGHADLSYVFNAAEDIAKKLNQLQKVAEKVNFCVIDLLILFLIPVIER